MARPVVTAGNKYSHAVYVVCPRCDAPFAITQRAFRGDAPIRCPRPYCEYEETHNLARTDDGLPPRHR